MAMRATNAKMDFEAFGVRDMRDIEIEASGLLRQGLSPVCGPMTQKGALLDSTERGRQGKCAMTTAQTRLSALPLLRPALACALVITIIAILPL
jgi:hypothetical protein